MEMRETLVILKWFYTSLYILKLAHWKRLGGLAGVNYFKIELQYLELFQIASQLFDNT